MMKRWVEYKCIKNIIAFLFRRKQHIVYHCDKCLMNIVEGFVLSPFMAVLCHNSRVKILIAFHLCSYLIVLSPTEDYYLQQLCTHFHW